VTGVSGRPLIHSASHYDPEALAESFLSHLQATTLARNI